MWCDQSRTKDMFAKVDEFYARVSQSRNTTTTVPEYLRHVDSLHLPDEMSPKVRARSSCDWLHGETSKVMAHRIHVNVMVMFRLFRGSIWIWGFIDGWHYELASHLYIRLTSIGGSRNTDRACLFAGFIICDMGWACPHHNWARPVLQMIGLFTVCFTNCLFLGFRITKPNQDNPQMEAEVCCMQSRWHFYWPHVRDMTRSPCLDNYHDEMRNE